jgi:TRAP-type C4-dicarboxylate transport system substrate-binding protein
VKSRFIITHCFLLLCLVSGCKDQGSAQNPPQTELSGKLDAALAMNEGTSRHNTLVKLAEDAAKAGDGDLVLKVIAEVDAGTARDNTCAICSEALAKQGNTSAATAVAKQIANETSRNNMLGKIASGATK